MTCGILIFPGAHGDKDLIRVLEGYFGLNVKAVWNRDADLKGIDILLIPGGFPCRGSSSSSQCMLESAIIEPMLDYAGKGKLLVGIGNGFRVLCETGLVPGELRMNKSQRFICRNTHIKPDNTDTPITAGLNGNMAYQIPIATGYGRFTAREETLVEMRLNEQILFRYCDEFGVISEAENPTGAVDNIAGICNREKNVFGLIPQPERAVLSHAGNRDGRGIFESLINSF